MSFGSFKSPNHKANEFARAMCGVKPDPLHPTFRALRDERKALFLQRMGADIAAHLFPDDAQVREDQMRARAALDVWDAQHAEEWNTLKPWYETRISKG